MEKFLALNHLSKVFDGIGLRRFRQVEMESEECQDVDAEAGGGAQIRRQPPETKIPEWWELEHICRIQQPVHNPLVNLNSAKYDTFRLRLLTPRIIYGI